MVLVTRVRDQGMDLRIHGLSIMKGGGEFLLIFQETSLAGLALDSATSSGLGRAPPLCNAGPHPGTTWNYKTGGIIHQLMIEQPGHAG
ncbi:hypothetical protein TNCV_873071 [Trichonephila clavipes]|nr:hypothetical protein TNCV_873071 [Trichonephila clavipes]